MVHDEVRILIFDDPTEQEDSQRPLRDGKLSNPRVRATRAACMEKIHEIPRACLVGCYVLTLHLSSLQYTKST
jgi:hypothetical protein